MLTTVEPGYFTGFVNWWVAYIARAPLRYSRFLLQLLFQSAPFLWSVMGNHWWALADQSSGILWKKRHSKRLSDLFFIWLWTEQVANYLYMGKKSRFFGITSYLSMYLVQQFFISLSFSHSPALFFISTYLVSSLGLNKALSILCTMLSIYKYCTLEWKSSICYPQSWIPFKPAGYRYRYLPCWLFITKLYY